MFNFDTESVDRLCAAILSLETVDECKAFLEDVCTISEIQDISQRLTAAMMLRRGGNYAQISEGLGISTATISRVNRCLNYGPGGYKTVLDRIDVDGGNDSEGLAGVSLDDASTIDGNAVGNESAEGGDAHD